MYTQRCNICCWLKDSEKVTRFGKKGPQLTSPPPCVTCEGWRELRSWAFLNLLCWHFQVQPGLQWLLYFLVSWPIRWVPCVVYGGGAKPKPNLQPVFGLICLLESTATFLGLGQHSCLSGFFTQSSIPLHLHESFWFLLCSCCLDCYCHYVPFLYFATFTAW